jgi:hypothetical protein
VIEQVDVARHPIAKVDKDIGEGVLHVRLGPPVARGFVAFEPREHRGGDVELDGELIMRDGGGDLVDLALERVVVDRVDPGVERIDQEQPDHGMRRHQIDLEFGAGRNCPGVFLPLELGIGIFCDVGVEQIVETNVSRRHAGFEHIAFASRAGGVHAKEFARFLKGRVFGEHRLKPADPVAALAGFAIREPLDPGAERRTHVRKHVARTWHRNAADKIHVA